MHVERADGDVVAWRRKGEYGTSGGREGYEEGGRCGRKDGVRFRILKRLSTVLRRDGACRMTAHQCAGERMEST